MKRNMKIAAVLTLALAVSGCAMLGFNAGQEAREELAPRMSMLWPVIAEEVQHGIDKHPTMPAADKGAAMLALDEWNRELAALPQVDGDALRVRTSDETDRADLIRLRDRDWMFFSAYAAQGIAHREVAGEIGPAGAELARGNLAWFDATLVALDGEPTDPE